MRGVAHRLRGERGSVLATTAIVLPVALLLMSFVIDVGNWFEHRRHLQMQADAAALAAAGDVRVPCSDTAIEARAAEYAFTRNAQIGGTPASNVSMAVNSATWPGQSTPADPDVRVGGPCATKMIDVKLAEKDVPLFVRLAGFDKLPFVNAHARVEINQADELKDLLPLSVTNTDFKKAQITFINEDTGATLKDAAGNDAVRSLATNGTDGNGNAIWDNAGSPVAMNFGSGVTQIGVRVTLSATGSLACGSTGVLCYDRTATKGLLFAQGYPAGPAVASGSEPRVRSVVLTRGTCNDDAYFTTTTTDCSVGIEATVDWGTASPVSDFGASVIAHIKGNDVTLTPSGGSWTGNLPVAAAAGGQSVTLDWQATDGEISGTTCGTGKGNQPDPCSGSLAGGTVVQRVFAASAAGSGPIRGAQIWESGAFGAPSFQQCSSGCTPHPLVVRIAVPSSLEVAQSASDPVYRLRALNGNSQTQVIDCDTGLNNFKEELAGGCHTPKYVVNTGESCSSYTGPAQLPDPSPCVVTQTSAADPGQVGAGLNERILGTAHATSCTSKNHWDQFPNLDNGDPRIVFFAITPQGAFSGNGNQAFPVQNFAAFYITGWQGSSGFSNPCQRAGEGDTQADSGEVVGHFIKYVELSGKASGNTPCNLRALGVCVSQLTR